jgi:hypothetical protein
VLNKTQKKIITLKNMGVDLYDIKKLKNIALENKMYDLIVYINNDPYDYFSFVSQINNKETP